MLVNGTPAQTISATDRGFAYGDGVFRTLRAVDGHPLHWSRHYAKLHEDCNKLALPCPAESLLLSETRIVAGAHAQAVVKIVVTRGEGLRGYAPPLSPAPLRLVMSTPYTPQPAGEGIAVHLCRLRLARQPALAGVKHLNRLENVLARSEWRDPAVREGLMQDTDGNAICGTMSNLFIVEKSALITPDLSNCGVAGMTRDRVITWALGSGIDCTVENLPLQRVLDATEVFLVNSLIGIWRVQTLGTSIWPKAWIADRIRHDLQVEDDALP